MNSQNSNVNTNKDIKNIGDFIRIELNNKSGKLDWVGFTGNPYVQVSQIVKIEIE